MFLRFKQLMVSKVVHNLKEFTAHIESSPNGKNLEVLVDEKLNRRWQCVLGARKPHTSWAVWPAG